MSSFSFLFDGPAEVVPSQPILDSQGAVGGFPLVPVPLSPLAAAAGGEEADYVDSQPVRPTRRPRRRPGANRRAILRRARRGTAAAASQEAGGGVHDFRNGARRR